MSEISPVHVIIDTDPGVDDVLALLLALASPHLLVVGITLTHGNCTLASTEKNLEKMFYALEKHLEQTNEPERWRGVTDKQWRKKHGAEEKIKVWKGCEGPVEGQAVTAKYFHGQDGLADCETRHPDLTPPSTYQSSLYTLSSDSALEGLSSLLAFRPSDLPKLAYIALGPFTSLAQLSERVDLSQSFEPILSMGGAVEHPGNTTPVAEFNYYADPWAARTLFSLSLPNLYIFPLDITTYLTLPFSLYASSIDPAFSSTKQPSEPTNKDPLVHFTSSFLEGTKEVMESFGGDEMELHDPTVVFALIEWVRSRSTKTEVNGAEGEGAREGEFAKGWEWKRVDFEVECEGTLTRGMLVLDHRASSKSATSITSRTGQTNRALAIEEHLALDVPEVEARRAEKKRKLDEEKKVSGARVVVSSPGSEVMRKELLERVWGVEA